MKILKNDDVDGYFPYPEDVKRIKSALIRNGYWAPDRDISSAWEIYSASMAARWLVVEDYTDEKLVERILPYLTEV